MHRLSFISFFAAFLICGITMAVIYLVLALLAFDLGGGETLQRVEAQRAALLFITLLLALWAGSIARKYARNGDRSAAYGIRAVLLICIVVTIVNYLSILSFATKFDKEAWVQSEYKPFKMSAALVRRDTLMNMPREHVKNLLGEASIEREYKDSGKGYMKYQVNGSWTLTIGFENGKVVHVGMRLPFLGV